MKKERYILTAKNISEIKKIFKLKENIKRIQIINSLKFLES